MIIYTWKLYWLNIILTLKNKTRKNDMYNIYIYNISFAFEENGG